MYKKERISTYEVPTAISTYEGPTAQFKTESIEHPFDVFEALWRIRHTFLKNLFMAMTIAFGMKLTVTS